MITSFEVGSIFQIIDKASPTIAKLSRAMSDFGKIVADTKKELQSLGNLKLGGLNTNLKTATEQVGRLAGAASKAETEIIASTDRAAASVGALGAAWRNAERAALAAGAAARGSVPSVGRNPRQAIAGAHTGGARSGFHISPLSVPTPGGSHASWGGGGDIGLLAAGGIAKGLYDRAQLERQAALAVWFANGNGTNMPSQDVQEQEKKQFIDTVLNVASETGKSFKELAELGVKDIQQGKGYTWPRRMAGLKPLLEAAATGSDQKGESIASTGDALIAFDHMMKIYDPTAMAALYPKLNILASASPQAYKRITTAAGYHIPATTAGLEVDPIEEMVLQTGLERAGVLNTKSGTWLREMAIRALPEVKGKVSDKKYNEKLELLRDFGLVDADGKPAWFTNGKPDEFKLLDLVREHAAGMEPDKRMKEERYLFGAQGAGAIGVLTDPKVIPQLKTLKGEIDAYKEGENYWEYSQKNNPVLQLDKAWIDLQRVLIDVGTVALPQVTSSFKTLDEHLKFISSLVPDWLRPVPGSLGNVAAQAGVTAATGGAGVGGLLGAIKDWWSGDAAKQSIQQGSEKGTESGSAKGAEQGVISGFQKMSFQGGADNGALLKNINYETADGDGGFTTVNGVTVPNGVARSSGAGANSSGAVPTGPGGGPLGRFPTNKRSVANIVADAWRKAGMTDSGIAGLMANIGEESAFNPTLRHADQPRFGGEAHYAHGLYQEGGAEWNHFAAWIGKNYPGSDWRDPKLQSEFAAWNLKTNYPGVWSRMAHGNREQAAEAYAAGYLKPAARYLASRLGKFRSHGVPDLGAYIGDHKTEPGTEDSDTASKAIPPSRATRPIVIHTNLQLDGRTVAKNTMRHIAGEGNAPARGGRLPDNLITRPLSI